MTDDELLDQLEEELRQITLRNGFEFEFENRDFFLGEARRLNISIADLIMQMRPMLIEQTKRFATKPDTLQDGPVTTPALRLLN